MRPRPKVLDDLPMFNILDRLLVGGVVYKVVGLETDYASDDVAVCLEVDDHGTFIPDEDRALEYYRVPMSILKAASPKVCAYQPPLFT